MASTYSPSLRIQLIETGTEFEAWGTPTDNNLGTVIEQAITGVESVSIANLTSYTLTTANAAVDQARNAVIILTGNLDANCDVIVPSAQKVYIVNNQTSNNKVVTIKTSGGNGVQISAGGKQLVYCNGVDVNSAINVNNIVGNLIVTGSETLDGNLTAQTISVNGSLTSNSGNLTFTSVGNVVTMQQTTGGFVFPSGTTAQRPGTPDVGMSRWNTTLGWYEIWNGTVWQQITGSFNVNYLVVAGGGGGGNGDGFQGSGGGGAGGMVTGTDAVSPGTSYSIVVGSGGSANNRGANSSAFGDIAIGGGAGAGTGNEGSINGGSGGGQRVRDRTEENYGPGSGTSGQGYAGGVGIQYIGGGGGGAGQVGQGISGGSGVSSSITGTATYYAGGGGGGDRNGGTGGGAGQGGGGNGSTAGTSNTGGGGGGGPYSSGKAGGSGVVIISYAYPLQRATGGTVTSYTSGGDTYWVHTFTTSGTFAT